MKCPPKYPTATAMTARTAHFSIASDLVMPLRSLPPGTDCWPAPELIPQNRSAASSWNQFLTDRPAPFALAVKLAPRDPDPHVFPALSAPDLRRPYFPDLPLVEQAHPVVPGERFELRLRHGSLGCFFLTTFDFPLGITPDISLPNNQRACQPKDCG